MSTTRFEKSSPNSTNMMSYQTPRAVALIDRLGRSGSPDFEGRTGSKIGR